MHSRIAHYLRTDQCPASPQATVSLGQLPTVYLPDIILYEIPLWLVWVSFSLLCPLPTSHALPAFIGRAVQEATKSFTE